MVFYIVKKSRKDRSLLSFQEMDGNCESLSRFLTITLRLYFNVMETKFKISEVIFDAKNF